MNARQNGIYYTALFNPFERSAFASWAREHNLTDKLVLEPFAGANSIINMLQSVGMAKKYQSYDLYPSNRCVKKRDTIKNYPKGYDVCITNPPWLYKSSAKRRGLEFPITHFDDMYKLCLSLALENNQYVGALIPASFMQANLFHNRLETVIFLNKPLFDNTENPVCLALFTPYSTDDIRVYNDDNHIGYYNKLKKFLPKKSVKKINFNDPRGKLGFIAIDNNTKASIRFCDGEELDRYKIEYSSRSITRIDGVDCSQSIINNLNSIIENIRYNTHDIFLTAFKGLRKDGKYRRRMEYRLARDIISCGT